MNSKRDNRKEIHTKIYYSETVERQKQRTNLASSKREVSHHIQRILDEINSQFLIRTTEVRKHWDDIFKVLKF